MTPKNTMSIAIISGKGGVGKTNIALNLSYALHRAKQRVLLMDCDLGLANLDILLGVTPEHTMEQLFQSDAPMESVAIHLEEDGFDFIPASSGLHGPTDYSATVKTLLLERLNPYAANFDYLFLDAGAGISPSVQTFAALAELRLVVITPEPTSLTDSYALMKVLSSHHEVRDFHILVNQAESQEEERTAYKRLASACEHFLGFVPTFLGGVRSDPMVAEAVRKQRPFILLSPSCRASKDLIAVAAKLHRLHQGARQGLVPGQALRTPAEEEAGVA